MSFEHDISRCFSDVIGETGLDRSAFEPVLAETASSIENLADHFGIGVEAAKKRAQRAVGAVQKELGRKPYEEQPRGAERRSVVSNAAARARQSSYYEG